MYLTNLIANQTIVHLPGVLVPNLREITKEEITCTLVGKGCCRCVACSLSVCEGSCR